MQFLNKPTQSIKAITLEVATTDLDFVTVYNLQSGRLNIGPKTDNGTIDETLTTIVPPPDIDAQASVQNINITNTDNIDHNLVVYFNDGTDRVIFKALLEPNWSAIWLQETGWKVYDNEGSQVIKNILQKVYGEYFPAVTGSSVNTANAITFIYGVFVNGARYVETVDYTISGTTVNFVVPLVADNVSVVYS